MDVQDRHRCILDDRLPGLLLDALTPVETAVLSAVSGVPYCTIRTIVNVDEIRKREICAAVQAVVTKHREVFAEYHGVLEFIVPFMAVTASQADCFLILADASRNESAMSAEPCSPRKALIIALIVLGPLALFGLVLFSKWRNR